MQWRTCHFSILAICYKCFKVSRFPYGNLLREMCNVIICVFRYMLLSIFSYKLWIINEIEDNTIHYTVLFCVSLLSEVKYTKFSIRFLLKFMNKFYRMMKIHRVRIESKTNTGSNVWYFKITDSIQREG